MTKWFRRAYFALIILPLLVFVVGCPKKPPPDITGTTPPPTSEKPARSEEVKDTGFKTPEVPEAPIEDQGDAEIRRLNEQKPLGTVYFDYDKADLRQDTLDQLKRNAEWMKSNPAFRVRLEGNCDERGTTEYNLALGERRAVAVKNYLSKAGIDEGRMETISYGEEHPADPGHSEGSWAKNRRVDFTIVGRVSR